MGSLVARRDFTDVRDIVAAYRLAAVGGKAGEVYNVCSGVDHSMREIAEGLVRRSGCDISFTVSPELERQVDHPIMVGSADRLHDQTGWEPEISFEQSLDDIYADALANIAVAESDST